MSRQSSPGIDPITISPGPPPEGPLPSPPTAHQRMLRTSTSTTLGLASLLQPQQRVQSAPLQYETGMPKYREPGYFDANLRRSSPLGVDENLAGLRGSPSLQVPLGPHQLHDPLHRVTRQTETRSSFPSDVSMSSITPSEAEMMSVGPISDPWGRGGHPRTTIDMSSPLPDHERFSNVPSIFDVATRPQDGGNLSGKPSVGPSPGVRGSRDTTETDPFFEVPGSRSTSTRPDLPPPSSQFQFCGPAPIFSLTAGTATGDEVITGSKTLEKSSVGSDETAPRKRHYEGCMLCSPLPSPSSSISSFMPDGPIFSPSDQRGSGPPPDTPLPNLIPQRAMVDSRKGHKYQQVDRSSAIQFNSLNPFQELEGEMAPYNLDVERLSPATPSINASSPVLFGEPGPGHFTAQVYRPLYTNPVHGGSLSTLIEGDEESQLSHGRQPSRHAVSKASHEVGQRLRSASEECNRPTTSTTVDIYGGEISRINTQGNTSQHSLLVNELDLPVVPPVVASAGKHRNIFKRAASPLSAIQEFASWSKRSSWRGVLRRENAPVPGQDPSDIELTAHPPVVMPNLATTSDPHPGQRLDQPGVDGAYELVGLSGPPGHEDGPNAIQITAPRNEAGLEYLFGRIQHVNHLRNTPRGRVIIRVLCALSMVFIVLLVTLPVVYVGIPGFAEKDLNRAADNITALSIISPKPSSVGFKLGLKLPDKVAVSAGNSEITLLGNGSHSVLDQTEFQKRDHTPDHHLKTLRVLGLLEVSSMGSGNFLFEGNNNHVFEIQDPGLWGEIIETMIFAKTGPEVRLRGSMKLRSLGITSQLKLNKRLVLPVVGDFNSHVYSYDFLSTRNETFVTHFALRTNTSLRLDLVWDHVQLRIYTTKLYSQGDLQFNILFGLTVVGHATVNSFLLRPGSTDMVARGWLNSDVLQRDPDLLAKVLASLFIRVNGNPTTALSLQGVKSTIGGEEITWLRPAVQRFQIALPAMGVGPEENSSERFEMGLFVDLRQTQAQVTSAYISGNLNLPFASKGFDSLIEEVGHGITLSTLSGTKFASVAFPMSPTPINSGKFHVSYPNGGSFVIENGTAWSRGFLKPLIQNKMLTVSVTGNLTAKLHTDMGSATIRDISLQKTSWNISGYGLANGKLTINSTSLKRFQGPESGLHMSVKIFYRSNALIQLKLGEVVFGVTQKSAVSPLGRLEISSFNLSNDSSYDGTLILGYGASKEEQELYNNFLTSFFAGGTIPLQLDTPSSRNNYVAESLKGVSISTEILSPGYTSRLVRKLGLLLSGSKEDQRIAGAVEFYNPFPIALSIHGFDLVMEISKDSAQVGRLEQISIGIVDLGPGQNFVLDAQLIEGVDVKGAKALFSDGNVIRDVTVKGKVAIGFGANSVGRVGVEFKTSVKLSVIKK